MSERIAIRGVTRDGNVVWYTGRAGDGYIASKLEDSFQYGFLRQANIRAIILNRMFEATGIWFTAIPVENTSG